MRRDLIDLVRELDCRYPGGNFFGRMKGEWLDALWRALLDLRPDHPTATTFARLKKREKAERLQALFADPAAVGASAEQAATVAAWLPDHFA